MSKRVYKLVRVMANGSLSPLFINKKLRIPLGEWMDAENHPTEGFAERFGWHCTAEMNAPHLKMHPKGGRPRVWVECLVRDWVKYKRPEKQGGFWVLANQIKFIKIIE
jgi:hypothetical protein